MRAATLLVATAVLSLCGCAEIAPPHPNTILKSPFGDGPLRVGMTKTEVRELWGEPSSIHVGDSDRWGSTRDTWVYEASFKDIPINVGYASRSRTLEFSGESLAAFHD